MTKEQAIKLAVQALLEKANDYEAEGKETAKLYEAVEVLTK